MWQANKMAQAEAHDAALRYILFKWQWLIALYGACIAETLTRFGAAQPKAADSTVMTESAAIAPAKTCAKIMCVVTNTEPKGVLAIPSSRLLHLVARVEGVPSSACSSWP